MILAPSTTITSNAIDEKFNDTTTPPSPTETSTDQDDLITGEQNRPRFISLIPAGTHKVNGNTIPSKSDQEEDKMKYQIYSDSTPKVEEDYVTSSSSDDRGDSTTPPSSSSSSEEEDDISTSEAQGTTERTSPPKPQLKHITLGKIPLTYQIIPLLPPREEKQQLLGREDTTPIGFFPPELQGTTLQQEEMMTDKAKREQQPTTTTSSESEGEGEIITGKPVPELQELPPEPLTYMVPPQREHDGETTVIWNLYPMTTDTDTSTDLTSPQSTINPLLERINDFLMKAKRHSLETETTTTDADAPLTPTTTSTEENDKNTEKLETTTSTEDSSSNDISTTNENENHFAISDTPEDSNGDLNPSSPVPIPEEPTEEIYTTTRHHPPTTTILYPTPNIPEIQDYYQQPQSPPESPITYFTPPPPPPPQQTTQNIIHLPPPSSPDQYFSDYSNINTLQQEQQPISPFYYTNPQSSSQNSAASLLRRRLMIQSLLNKLASSMPSSSTTTPPPSQPLYIPNDSYWPSKYFNNRGSSMNTNTNMFSPPVSASDYNTNYPNYQTNYNTNYNPYNTGGFSRNTNYYSQQPQNSYVFPQQQQTTAIPLQAALNVIAASSEAPSYSPYGGSFGGGADDYSSIPSMPSSSSGRGSPYNSNPYYPSSSSNQFRRSSDNYNNFVNDNYYSSSSYYPSSSTQGSAYDVNFRPVIPYKPYEYPVTSSELVNRLMYAPMYPYEQYNRRMNMRTAGFY